MAGAFRRVPIWITVSGLTLFLSGVALFIGTIDPCAGVVLVRRHRQDRCRRNTEACRIVSANPQERRLDQAKAGEGRGFVGLRAVDV